MSESVGQDYYYAVLDNICCCQSCEEDGRGSAYGCRLVWLHSSMLQSFCVI